MPELYLRLFDRILTPIILFLALFLLIRGHSLPGGGFIAGLMVSTAFQLQILSRGDVYVRDRIGPYLPFCTGLGLAISVISALIGITQGGFFKGIWWGELHLGPVEIGLGTPVLFDLGVFLVVFSVVISYLLELNRSEDIELS